MPSTNVLLLSQIAGYVIGLVLSLCVVVPMSMHQHEFSGHCLLFSEGKWQDNGQLLVAWASRAYCNYVITVGVLMIVVCCIQVYRMSMLMCKGQDSSFFSAFIEAVVCTMFCILAVSAAVMVTLGFMTWCQVMTQRFPSCEMADQDIDQEDKISTKGFYIELGSAQFGAWGAFATWVGQAVFAVLKLCRYHQLENIRVSMYRERQRLVNENEGSVHERSSTPPAALAPQ